MAIHNIGYDADGNALDFTTIATAWAAIGTTVTLGDTFKLWYSNANKNLVWGEVINGGSATTNWLSIVGGVSGVAVQMSDNYYFYRLVGDLSGQSAQITISDIQFHGGVSNSYVLQYNDTSGSGSGVKVSRCLISTYTGLRITAGATKACIAECCIFLGCRYGIYAPTAIKMHRCSGVFCELMIDAANAVSEIIGCVALSCSGDGFYRVGSCTGSYNASDDGTAPGTSSVATTISASGMWMAGSNGLPFADPRLSPINTGDLTEAGTAIAGVTLDFNGQTIGASPSIGASEPVWLVDQDYVINTANGNWIPPNVNDVKLNTTFGVDGTSLTGLLDTGVLTPTLSITDKVATIADGETDYTNILIYTTDGNNQWGTLGTRIGNGDIDFTNVSLPSGDYVARVVSVGSPGTVSDTESFTISSILSSDYPDDNWDRWIFASICNHFDLRRGDYTMYVEGTHRQTSDLKDFFELRVDGPWFTEISKNYWKVYIEVNVLCQSVKDNKDFHRMRKITGHVSKIFERCINIYKYGNSVQDDSSLLGTMVRVDDHRGKERIQINHFGQIEPRMELEQASVEAHYVMQLSV